MAVNAVTCVSGVLTVSKGCSLGCDAAVAHLEPLLGERSLLWHHACVSKRGATRVFPSCTLTCWMDNTIKHIKDSQAGPTTALGQYLLSPNTLFETARPGREPQF